MSYGRFAYVYDSLMKDAPYEKWLELMLAKLDQYGREAKTVLDLACGTGEFTVELARHGFQAEGADLSEEMLSIAHEKAAEAGVSIPLYQQNMAELTGLGTYDAVTIFCDSLNYLQEEQDVLNTFKGVSRHLEEGGFLMFDVHSVYKMNHLFANKTFALAEEDISYIWECFPGDEPDSVEHELSFFVKDESSGLYERFDECHYQRTYPYSFYKDKLEEAGFEVLELLSDLEDEPIHAETERIMFIARKK